jgi:alpha-1,2-mannosyltransferase
MDNRKPVAAAVVQLRYLKPLLVLALAVCCMWTVRQELPRISDNDRLWDFGAFVASGRAAAAGLDPYGIYPPLTPHVAFPGFEVWNPNLNPPISALLFQAFDTQDVALGKRVWTAFSAAFYLASIGLLLLRYGRGVASTALLGLVALGMAGFWDTLYLGQIYTPLVFVAVVAWILLEKKQLVTAAVLIGLLISMKPNFLVWPALLIVAGYWLPGFVALAVAAMISTVPVLVFGAQIYLDWLHVVAGDGDRAAFLTNSSLSGFAARAGFAQVGTGLSILLLLALSSWAFVRRPNVMDLSAFALTASVLASPLGWIHYTLFLLPVLFHHRDRGWARIALIALMVPVPVVLGHFGKPVVEQLTFGSIYGWALVLVFLGLAAQQRHALVGDQGARL